MHSLPDRFTGNALLPRDRELVLRSRIAAERHRHRKMDQGFRLRIQHAWRVRGIVETAECRLCLVE